MTAIAHLKGRREFHLIVFKSIAFALLFALALQAFIALVFSPEGPKWPTSTRTTSPKHPSAPTA